MRIVIPNPFPIYLECMFVIIFYLFIYQIHFQGLKAWTGLMCKVGKNKSKMRANKQ